MKMKIGQRDLFLLFTLGIIGSLALIYTFVLSPMMKNMDTLESENNALISERTIMSSTIPTLPSLKTLLETRTEEVSEILNEFEAPITASEFEHKILPLMTKYNMKVISSSFTDPKIVTPIAIETLPEEYQYEIGDMIDEFKGASDDSETIPETQGMILSSNHEYVVETTYARYLYLIEDIRKWNTSIKLVSSSYDTEESQARFMFDVYFVDQLTEDEISQYQSDVKANGTGTGSANEDPHDASGK